MIGSAMFLTNALPSDGQSLFCPHKRAIASRCSVRAWCLQNRESASPSYRRARWTLQLLGDRVVELHVVESISTETVHRTLKKPHQALAEEDLVSRHSDFDGLRLFISVSADIPD